MEKDISKNVLEKIKDKAIKPTAAWKFLLKDYLWWTMAVFSLNIGGIAMSVIIYLLVNNDFDVYKHINGNIISFILLSMPYFWIVCFAVFIFVVHYNFKNTKEGYKVEFYKIILIVLGISILLGGLFYKAGVAQILDYNLENKIPFYKEIINPRFGRWQNPNMGLLAGSVMETELPKYILVKDFSGKDWVVFVQNSIPVFEAKELNSREIIGLRFKFIGEVIDEGTFNAFDVRPFLPVQQNMKFLRNRQK